MKDYLLLKWGTLKGWDFSNNEKAQSFLEEYVKLGVSYGCAMQKNTERQKEIICELIDVCNGDIQNDWTGKMMTKEEAKEYVVNYGK